MSGKQAKRLRRLEKDVEIVRDGLKEVTCREYGQKIRLSDAESGLKDQDARLKSLEGGLDSFHEGPRRAQGPGRTLDRCPEGR